MPGSKASGFKGQTGEAGASTIILAVDPGLEEVRQLRAEGLSLREIGDRVGFHWTRVQQILCEEQQQQQA
jgi:hypothetical protein